MSKISIIGAGNVGTSCADYLLTQSMVDEIVLLDIIPGLAEGKALDLTQKCSLISSHTSIYGFTGNYSKTQNSEIVVITSGVKRSSHQSRSDILIINAQIVAEVVNNVLIYSPDCIIIMVSNPVDAMCYHALKLFGIEPHRIIGLSGLLDTVRFITYLSEKLDISPSFIDSMVIGGHNNSMVPLLSQTYVKGQSIHNYLSALELNQIQSMTKNGGDEITILMKTSAYFCPGTAAACMIDSIINNRLILYSCSTFVQGQYGINGLCIGLPVILSRIGIQEIIEIDLCPEELNLLHESVNHILEDIDNLNSLTK